MSKLASMIALFVAASVVAPSDAWPCLNAVQLTGNKAVREIKRSEEALRTGNYRGLIHYLRDHEFADERLQARAELVQATARMRSLKDKSYVTQAIRMLRDQREDRPDDPILQARLAEALVRDASEASVTEARTLIEDLVARDVVPDAVGWVIAATVRDGAGDAAGRDAALDRCKKVVKKFAKVPCRVIAA